VTASLEHFALAKVALANPGMLRVKPDVSLFMAQYMRRFRAKRSGRNLILHSHLPPLTSEAYARLISRHFLARAPGPSHAQVGLTNACPQNCEYCYNKQRAGEPMDTDTILQVVDDLKRMGVVWLGFTGGEPLLNRDLVEITRHAADGCALKLFTTGCGLTPRLAESLAEAGIFSVSVSVDHWEAASHDAGRRHAGAFRAALDAVAMFEQVPGLHVGVSSVLSPAMIHNGDVARLLSFFAGLGVDEAWLSEVKPTIEAFWHDELVITEQERLALVALQDSYNRSGGMTVNYLGHFEGAETFGCNAGCKMVYVDAFGEVSPCVFLPMTFGNVRDRPLAEIVDEMRACFPGQDRCFINQNYRLLAEVGGELPLNPEHSRELVRRAQRRPQSALDRRLYRGI
jgi:MoaA/NifB/PqqE/SkfB family radical SAM enzyme